MFTLGNSKKLYLPMHGNNCFIEIENPVLMENRISNFTGIGYYPIIENICIDLSFKATKVNVVDGKMDIFELLTDNLTIKEALTIVENKLKQRKEK